MIDAIANVARMEERTVSTRQVGGSNPSVGSLPFIRPCLPPPEAWLPFLEQSYRARYFSNGGPCVRQLEAELQAEFGGERRAVLTASGTAGITATLLALDCKGTVIVPAFTFAATAQAVLAAGCRPVLCDVSEDTWEMDPRELIHTIGGLYRHAKPAAIIHVRTFGFCRDLERIEDIAARYAMPLIVDSAAALGGKLPDGRHAGCQGVAEVFSLHATKPFGVGEGGLVMTKPILAERVRRAINFGLRDGDPAMAGINGKISEFHAAVGLAMLRRITGHLAVRTAVSMIYQRGITPGIPGGFGHPPWQLYPTLVSDPERIIRHAAERGIELRRYYRPALHRSRHFYEKAPFPVSEHLAEHMLCLPIYSDMSTAEQKRVIETLNDRQD